MQRKVLLLFANIDKTYAAYYTYGMPNTFSRRTVLRAVFAALPLSLAGTPPISLAQADDHTNALHELERLNRGRLGLALLNSQGTPLVSYRAEERFPLCSTSKLMMTAAVLHASMSEPDIMLKPIAITQQDMLSYSPITKAQVGKSLSLRDLCAAAMQYSDNTAANLLMRQVGGPKGVTAFARAMGDNIFRLDRWEPELNTCLPQDPRDTSSPLAMAASLHAVCLQGQGTPSPTGRTALLGAQQQQQLLAWLRGNTTGAERIAAGTPEKWQVGDKTGSGDYGTTNDVAIVWAANSTTTVPSAAQSPPQAPVYTLSVYFTQQKAQAPMRADIVAQATRIALASQLFR